jgi:hypothetical protein
MSENIFLGIEDKENIGKTLKKFDKERGRSFEKKYEYAEELIHCRKLDLDLAIINIEAHINSIKNFAAIIALAIVLFSSWLSSSVIVEGLSAYRLPVELGATLFFASLSFRIFMRAEKETAWLHSIKIAITQKSNPDYKRLFEKSDNW